MAEVSTVHIRRTLIDAVAWTPIAVSLSHCSRLAMKFGTFEAIKFRSDPDNAATELLIAEGKEEFFDWPHTGQRPVANEVFGYLQSSAATDYVYLKETT